MSAELSLMAFFKQFPDEKAAEAHFVKLRWPDGVCCPYCHNQEITNATKPMPYHCRTCRKYFSLRTGTILTESKLPLQKWLLATYILTTSTKGISSILLAKYLETTQKTAWFLAMRIREGWAQNNDKLGGIVEVDEVYIGGLEKNKHADKKLEKGRGSVGKIPVVGLKERNGNIKAVAVEATNTETLTKMIRSNVESGTKLYTDQYRAYRGLSKDYDHKRVKHSVGEYVRGQVHTNGIESFWALLKRGYYGIYHHMSKKHLQKYVDEFAARHNMLKSDGLSRICLSFQGAIGRRLTYSNLIGK